MVDDGKMTGEPTTLSPALIGFYAACAVVGIGAAMAAIVAIVFPEQGVTSAGGILGVGMVLGGGFAAWRALKVARKET